MKWEKKNAIVKQPKHRQENTRLRTFTAVNAAILDPAAFARKWEPCAGLRFRGQEDAEQEKHWSHVTSQTHSQLTGMSEPSREKSDSWVFLVCSAFSVGKRSVNLQLKLNNNIVKNKMQWIKIILGWVHRQWLYRKRKTFSRQDDRPLVVGCSMAPKVSRQSSRLYPKW